MFKWFRELMTGVVSEFGGKTLSDVFKGEVKSGAGIFTERIKRVIEQNPRTDVLYVLLALEENEAASLWTRHREAMAAGTENRLVAALGQALPKKGDGALDLDKAKEVFAKLAKMTEADFNQVVEELTHDPIAQYVRRYLKEGRSFAEAIVYGVSYSMGYVFNEVKTHSPEWDDKIAGKLGEFEAWLDKKGVR